MADLSNDSIKGAPGMHEVPGHVPPEDAVEIVFKEGTKIEGRKPGKVYAVNSVLAHHYVEVTKDARYVEGPGKSEKKDEPPALEDRAVKAPPRGPKH